MQINTVGVQGSQSGLNIQVKMNSGEYRISYLKGNEWTGNGVLALKSDLPKIESLNSVEFSYNSTLYRYEITMNRPNGERAALWWNNSKISYDHFDGTKWENVWAK